MQFIYPDRAGEIMGYTEGNDWNPEISIDVNASDPLTSFFGTYLGFSDYYAWDRAIYSVGFRSSSGAQYGPYGGTTGTPFSYSPLLGAWGTAFSGTRRLCTLGFWGTPSAPPPAPPLPVPPSPDLSQPSGPPPPQSPAANRIQSPTFGSPAGWQSDDGQYFRGKLNCSSCVPPSAPAVLLPMVGALSNARTAYLHLCCDVLLFGYICCYHLYVRDMCHLSQLSSVKLPPAFTV